MDAKLISYYITIVCAIPSKIGIEYWYQIHFGYDDCGPFIQIYNKDEICQNFSLCKITVLVALEVRSKLSGSAGTKKGYLTHQALPEGLGN